MCFVRDKWADWELVIKKTLKSAWVHCNALRLRKCFFSSFFIILNWTHHRNPQKKISSFLFFSKNVIRELPCRVMNTCNALGAGMSPKVNVFTPALGILIFWNEILLIMAMGSSKNLSLLEFTVGTQTCCIDWMLFVGWMIQQKRNKSTNLFSL